jgi:uncharacterized cupin superfamily protein
MNSGIIVTDMRSLTPQCKNEHEPYVYHKYAVTDENGKYENAGPEACGGNGTVVAFYTLPPGKSSYPFHYHVNNEEVFYIISGQGVLDTPNGTRGVAAGDVIICPAGAEGAHRLTNASDTEHFVYLDVDTNRTPDVVYYPRSSKVGIRAAGGIRDNYHLDSAVAYYQGE